MREATITERGIIIQFEDIQLITEENKQAKLFFIIITII